jgi:hypothetical protein
LQQKWLRQMSLSVSARRCFKCFQIHILIPARKSRGASSEESCLCLSSHPLLKSAIGQKYSYLVMKEARVEMILGFSRSQTITHTHTHPVGPLSPSDKLIVEAATCTTGTGDEHSCRQWDSNPRSQESSGCRPTPYTARLSGSAGEDRLAFQMRVATWLTLHVGSQCIPTHNDT